MHIYLKTSTQLLLNRSTLKSIFRASQDFPRNLHLKPKHLKASSYSNVGVLLKCDILWKSLRNIAQRAFWLLGKLDSQPLLTNKGHRKIKSRKRTKKSKTLLKKSRSDRAERCRLECQFYYITLSINLEADTWLFWTHCVRKYLDLLQYSPHFKRRG